MAGIGVYDIGGARVGEASLPEAVATVEVKPQVLHDYVLMLLANRRAYSASTKTRGEVSGGGVKPWRQKGTGRARAGSLTSPLFRGGGTVFGPKPRQIRNRLPIKVRRQAFAMALAEKVRSDRLVILRQPVVDPPKTKVVHGLFTKLGVAGSVLVVTQPEERGFARAARNLASVSLRSASEVNAYDILAHTWMVVSEAGLAVMRLDGKVTPSRRRKEPAAAGSES